MRLPQLLLFLLFLLTLPAFAGNGNRCLVGIHHIPVAVRDLDRAADSYRDLGFSIKSGRFHQDGIRNQHIKFKDGEGIELITAPQATDDITAQYVRLLAQGEGPAFLSFHTPNLAAVESKLQAAHYQFTHNGPFLNLSDPRLNFVFFFEGNNLSPTDRPEHFAHRNTAFATSAVWIADGDDSPLIRLLATLGAHIKSRKLFVPTETTAKVAQVANGEVVFLSVSRQLISGRQIIGVTLKTRDLTATRHLLATKALIEINHSGQHSLMLDPKHTYNLWLEFRQAR